MQGPIIPKFISTLLKQNKGSQNIYNILNKIKWNQLYNINEESWEYIFQAPFQISKCTKLRWFQVTINHRILVTNKFLYQINHNNLLNFMGYKVNVQSLYQSHKEIALNNNEIQKFLHAWSPFQKLIG